MFKKIFSKYEDDLKNCKKDLSNIKSWYRQIPNLLTISRPIGMIPANILFFTGNVVPAIILTGCLLLTDLFDGKLARKWNVQSKFGADLDAVCDKLMFLGLSMPLLVNYPFFIVNIMLEGAIASVNLMGRAEGLDTKTVYSGKIKTWFLSLSLCVGYLVQFFNIPSIAMKISTIITALSQGVALGEYVCEYKRMMDEKNELENEMEIEDDIIFESLSDEEQDKLLEKLSCEREFILSTVEPGKVYTGKKRVRVMMQEKKNNSYID